MKSISKKQCKAITQWKNENKSSPQNLTYDNSPKQEMLSDLLKEQGYLCAYTMKRITATTAHIEHIYPRGLTKEQTKQTQEQIPKYQNLELEWHNLVATFPENGACAYGEKQKENYDPENGFISPINLDVKKHFKFKQDGEIEGLTNEARTTIDVLNLNHEILKNNRKIKIQTAITHAMNKNTTVSNVQKRIEQLRQLNTKGEYEEYCEATAQRLEKIISQKKAFQQNKNSTKKKR